MFVCTLVLHIAREARAPRARYGGPRRRSGARRPASPRRRSATPTSARSRWRRCGASRRSACASLPRAPRRCVQGQGGRSLPRDGGEVPTRARAEGFTQRAPADLEARDRSYGDVKFTTLDDPEHHATARIERRARLGRRRRAPRRARARPRSRAASGRVAGRLRCACGAAAPARGRRAGRAGCVSQLGAGRMGVSRSWASAPSMKAALCLCKTLAGPRLGWNAKRRGRRKSPKPGVITLAVLRLRRRFRFAFFGFALGL